MSGKGKSQREAVVDEVRKVNQAAADVLFGEEAGIADINQVIARERERSDRLAAVATKEQAAAESLESKVVALREVRQQPAVGPGDRDVARRNRRIAWILVIVVAAILIVASILFAVTNAKSEETQSANNIEWDLPADAAAPLAVIIVILALALLYLLLKDDLGKVVLGADGRLSTSKTTAAAWTFSLVLALLYFAIAGALGRDFEIDSLYLLLLGGPFAAWVITGAVTKHKIEEGTLQKVDSSEVQPARDLVADDNGGASLTDLQYLGFNLVALAYFWVNLNLNGNSLPPLPEGLVFLTSAGSLAYLGKKSLQANAPYITSVSPLTGSPAIKAGERIVVRGGNFTPPGAAGDVDVLAGVRVRFTVGEKQRVVAVLPRLASQDGQPRASVVRRTHTNPKNNMLEVRVPVDVSGVVEVVVVTLAGVETSPFPISVDGNAPAADPGPTPTPPQAGGSAPADPKAF